MIKVGRYYKYSAFGRTHSVYQCIFKSKKHPYIIYTNPDIYCKILPMEGHMLSPRVKRITKQKYENHLKRFNCA